MDIRNISVELLQEGFKDPLGVVYKLGKEQALAYQKMQGKDQLPDFPFNINIRKNQEILKDFIGRIIEEITEGYESMLAIKDILEPVGYNTYIYEDNHKVQSQIINHLQNLNEEQADVTGFFITLLLYSNILAEDIESYCLNNETFTSSFGDGKPELLNIFSFGLYLLHYSDRVIGYKIYEPPLHDDKLNSVIPGFHSLSENIIECNIKQWWQIVYQLNIARNLLKNRPWKNTEVMTKEIDYQEALVKAFICYLGNLTLNGYTPESWYTLFHHKQALNLWRISSNY